MNPMGLGVLKGLKRLGNDSGGDFLIDRVSCFCFNWLGT